jgi:hypothetical protein
MEFLGNFPRDYAEARAEEVIRREYYQEHTN